MTTITHDFTPDPEVDRIARIIAEAIDGHGFMFDDGDGCHDHWTSGYRDAAKAVLVAMMEPDAQP